MEDFLTARLDDVEEFMRNSGAMENFYESFPFYDPNVDDSETEHVTKTSL